MAVISEIRLGVGEALEKLDIVCADFLDDVSGRSKCRKCGKSRKYFCYTCYISMDEIADRIPRVKLPLRVDIIKHPREVDGKSTAVHAAVLAPNDVSIYTFPNFPNYEQKDKVLLVFPGKDSLSLSEMMEHFNVETLKCVEREGLAPDRNGSTCSNEAILRPRLPIERLVFIDSTWNQVRGIRKDERLKGITRVELRGRESCFWRFQRGKPRTYLSTIEAIYYFLVDLHVTFIHPEYCGEYDNLLFFFKYMFRKIHSIYDPSKLRVYDPKFQ